MGGEWIEKMPPGCVARDWEGTIFLVVTNTKIVLCTGLSGMGQGYIGLTFSKLGYSIFN